MTLTVHELALAFLVELHNQLCNRGRGKMLAGKAQPGDRIRSVVTSVDERDLGLPLEAFEPRFIAPAACAVANDLEKVAEETRRALRILELPVEKSYEACCTTRELGLSVRASIICYPAPPEVRLAPAEGCYVIFEVAYRPQ